MLRGCCALAYKTYVDLQNGDFMLRACVSVSECIFMPLLHMFNNNNNTKIQSQKCKLICKCKFHSRQLFTDRQTKADDDSKHACQVSINIALALPLWHTLLHSHPLSLCPLSVALPVACAVY